MSKTIVLQRIASGKDSSLGLFYLDPASGNPTCFVVEDEHRDVKVKGETRIDAGRYEITKREVVSPMTEKYRGRYPWFDFHIMLNDTPRHEYVYIHAGNTDDHTDGCLLVNFNALILDGESQEYMGGRSRDAFEVVYKAISKMLEDDRVFIIVKDEQPIVI